jgi:nucleotide-binding universal stress UspA family protein
VGESLVAFTKQRPADLVVVGSRGMGAVKSTFMSMVGLGSVSGYLVHNLHCPVAVCRGREEDTQDKVGASGGRVGLQGPAAALAAGCQGPCGGREGSSLHKRSHTQRCPALAKLPLSHAVRAVHAAQEVRKVMVSLDDSEASKKALEVRLLVLLRVPPEVSGSTVRSAASIPPSAMLAAAPAPWDLLLCLPLLNPAGPASLMPAHLALLPAPWPCLQWVVRHALGPKDELHLVCVALPVPYPVRLAVAATAAHESACRLSPAACLPCPACLPCSAAADSAAAGRGFSGEIWRAWQLSENPRLTACCCPGIPHPAAGECVCG